MLRRSLVVVAALATATGCQSKSAQVTSHPNSNATTASTTLRSTSVPLADTAPVRECEAVPAAALVFDPPMIQDDPPLQLSRADRAPSAFLGYDGPIVESYYIRFDDRQVGYGTSGRFSGSGSGGRFGASGNFDMYERRAITERTGVRYR
jgi:hypothetical protein